MENRTDIFERLSRMESRNHWRYMVENDVLWCKEYNFLYAACSKNACSTIKQILATVRAGGKNYKGSPHDRKKTGLLGLRDIPLEQAGLALCSAETFRFAFSRNPFDRAVSCFLNRVDSLGLESYDLRHSSAKEFQNNRAKIISWKSGLLLQDVDPMDKISFRDFIEFICEQDPFDMDRHWYHQFRSMHLDFIDFDFIGKVENFDHDIRFVMDKISLPFDFSINEKKLNSSKSRNPIESYFEPDLEKIFVEKFQEDFETFDYPQQITRGNKITIAANFEDEPKRGSNANKESIEDYAFLVLSDGDVESIRRCVKSIRSGHGENADIFLYCRLDEDRYIEDFCQLNRVKAAFVGRECTKSQIYNVAKTEINKAYLIFCGEEQVLSLNSGVKSAIGLLREKRDLSFVGGLELESSQNSQRWLNFSNFILKDSDPDFLLMLPIEYSGAVRKKWERSFYSFCETLQEPFVASRHSLRDIDWDESLDGRCSNDDFFLRFSPQNKYKTVLFFGFYADKKPYKKRVLLDFNMVEYQQRFMRKWRLSHYMVYGKFHLFYDDETQESAYLPFRHRDALSNEQGFEVTQHYYSKIRSESPGLLPFDVGQVSSDKSFSASASRATDNPHDVLKAGLPLRKVLFYPFYLMIIWPWIQPEARKAILASPVVFFGKASHPVIRFGQKFFGYSSTR